MVNITFALKTRATLKHQKRSIFMVFMCQCKNKSPVKELKILVTSLNLGILIYHLDPVLVRNSLGCIILMNQMKIFLKRASYYVFMENQHGHSCTGKYERLEALVFLRSTVVRLHMDHCLVVHGLHDKNF